MLLFAVCFILDAAVCFLDAAVVFFLDPAFFFTLFLIFLLAFSENEINKSARPGKTLLVGRKGKSATAEGSAPASLPPPR